MEALENEETKLLQAHYAEAVSLSVLQKEQKRIGTERLAAELRLRSVTTEQAALEANLESALGRVERCDEIYQAGDHRVRRELCFALFRSIFVDEQGVVGSDLAGPFTQLLDPGLPKIIQQQIAGILAETKPGSENGGTATAELGVQRLRRRPLERPWGPLFFEQKNPEPDGLVQGSNESLLVG